VTLTGLRYHDLPVSIEVQAHRKLYAGIEAIECLARYEHDFSPVDRFNLLRADPSDQWAPWLCDTVIVSKRNLRIDAAKLINKAKRT
jgi:hypothetical protein